MGVKRSSISQLCGPRPSLAYPSSTIYFVHCGIRWVHKYYTRHSHSYSGTDLYSCRILITSPLNHPFVTRAALLKSLITSYFQRSNARTNAVRPARHPTPLTFPSFGANAALPTFFAVIDCFSGRTEPLAATNPSSSTHPSPLPPSTFPPSPAPPSPSSPPPNSLICCHSPPPRVFSTFNTKTPQMPALHLIKREHNWAYREPGVILVFCIIGAIAILLIALVTYKRMAARKARQQQ